MCRPGKSKLQHPPGDAQALPHQGNQTILAELLAHTWGIHQLRRLDFKFIAQELTSVISTPGTSAHARNFCC